MKQPRHVRLAATLLGAVTASGCIGSIGSISTGPLLSATVNGNVSSNVNQTQNQQNVSNGSAEQSGQNGSQGAPPPTPAPTPTPLPTPEPTPKVTGASLEVTVHDDTNQLLSGATVELKLLAGTFTDGSTSKTLSTQVGKCTFEALPSGVNMALTVSKPGFTTRSQAIEPMPAGGRMGSGVYLSDNPEVTSASPALGATGVDPNSSITLTFSEPVNTADVENGFGLCLAGFTSDSPLTLSSGGQLPIGVDDKTGAGAATKILDGSHFTVAWSNNNQTATFSPRPGVRLPTDKDATKCPTYVIWMDAYRDAAGSGRNNTGTQRLVLDPNKPNGDFYRFKVAADTTAPKVLSITPVNKGDTAGGQSDVIRVMFSEPLVLYPLTTWGATMIPKEDAAGYALNPAHFKYEVADTKPASPAFTPTSAKFYDGDATKSTIELTVSNNVQGSGDGFAAGDTVWVEVAGSVIDPAGNGLVTSNGTNVKSGKAI